MDVERDWLLTPHRVAVYLPTGTIVAADLHLGYNEARRRGGEAVPRSTLADQLEPLRQAARDRRVTRLVIAGDLFEESPAVELVHEFLHWIDRAGLELVGVVPGNHDRGLEDFRALLPLGDRVELGRWRVVHGDQPLPGKRIVQGHVHPCIRWRGCRLPCFLVSKDRLVLPAFSADAAGVDVHGDTNWQGFRIRMIVNGRVVQWPGTGGQELPFKSIIR